MRIVIAVLVISSALYAQKSDKQSGQQPGYIDETEYFIFYNHLWFNMHHFFYLDALTEKVNGKSIIDSSVIQNMPENERNILRGTTDYYKNHLLDKDLRMSEEMTRFKQWVLAHDNIEPASVPEEFKELIKILMTVRPVYEKHFWQRHSEENLTVLKNNVRLIRETEKDIVDSLSLLTRQYWQAEKIRVDICYVAKATPRNMRNRPYTSLFPTHIVMNASGSADKPQGNWLELLFHEASHNLISGRFGFIGGTILDVARAGNHRSPRGLWHACLFYFSGKVVQQQLSDKGFDDYQLYMKRHHVFSSYFPHLDAHLPGYMRGEKTFAETVDKIITDIRK